VDWTDLVEDDPGLMSEGEMRADPGVGDAKNLTQEQIDLAKADEYTQLPGTYPLSEVPEAIRYLEEGHAQAKVVITV
jgi:D-arabinose 1-dehydrogenase-like Zn-dependent alcohol dehydrogenase